MKSILESTFPVSVTVEKLAVDTKHVAIFFTANVTSVSPQRFVKADFKVFNPQWTINHETGKIKTNGAEPQFDILHMELIKLYPTQTLETDGFTKDEIKAFIQNNSPALCQEIMNLMEH